MQAYSRAGADELVFLDITATQEGRKTLASLVNRIAAVINIPFTVGGGVRSVDDVSLLLDSGADKIAVNTAAVEQPGLVYELAHRFGSQCIVLAMDVKQEGEDWFIYLNGGRKRTGINALDWAKQAEGQGAGEILLTSMDRDGTEEGFALAVTNSIACTVKVPVIASGGAGRMQDFADVFEKGRADAALAASVFHFKEMEIQELKKFLSSRNIPVRI
jgi:imidazole glycerol-phosphate synthase subunit HisF